MCFQLQAYLGLRISEAVEVRGQDIDFKRKQIRIFSRKTNEIDFLPLHDKAYKLLLERVRKCSKQISEHEGYLIYPDDEKSSRANPLHLTEAYMRRKCLEYIRKAKMDDSYAVVANVGGQCNGVAGNRKLHRLSTHSLRHYFITKVYKQTLDPIVTQKLARHREFSSTRVYINISKEDIREGMERAFAGKKESANDLSDMEEFMQFYKLWKEMRG